MLSLEECYINGIVHSYHPFLLGLTFYPQYHFLEIHPICYISHKRGPVWDGLAKAKGNSGEEIILLVEAKAHLSEMKSELRATSLDSVSVIRKTFQKFRQRNGIDEKYA